MLDNKDKISIEKLLNKKIIYSKLLSNSFGINCIKLKTLDNKNYIVKYYKNLNKGFNAIESEGKNLKYLNNLNLNLFPLVRCDNSKYLIISFINNNNHLPKETKNDFLDAILSIHSLKNKKYGFGFDTQIGGLKQINKNSNNWVNFFRDYRLGYIYKIINSIESIGFSINNKIELLLSKLENYIPNRPQPCLLHGDLWEGNILFHDRELVGLIDPGSFYGHNELEIAYLRWFNPKFIDENFLEKYNYNIKIENEYLAYEPIYQLYYSLLNVYLWDKNYIKDVERLLEKIKI